MSAPSHPVLILVRGLPGSGKSYLAKRLEQHLQQHYGSKATVTLDPDATDYQSSAYQAHVKQQTAEGVEPILHPYRFLRAQAYNGIEADKISVWNQPFTNLDSFKKVTARLQEYAQQHRKDLPLLVVEVQTDRQVAKSRVDERKKQGGHGPSDATFARFSREYTSFAQHGYQTITVDGQADADQAAKTILQSVKALYQ